VLGLIPMADLNPAARPKYRGMGPYTLYAPGDAAGEPDTFTSPRLIRADAVNKRVTPSNFLSSPPDAD